MRWIVLRWRHDNPPLEGLRPCNAVITLFLAAAFRLDLAHGDPSEESSVPREITINGLTNNMATVVSIR